MNRSLRIVVVYPDLLGTYGDGGNGLVLARRAERRGIPAQLIEASSDGPLPRCKRRDSPLSEAVARTATRVRAVIGPGGGSSTTFRLRTALRFWRSSGGAPRSPT